MFARGAGSRQTCGNPASTHPKVLLGFGRGDIEFNRVHVGDKLWKTSDPELERRVRQTFEGDKPRFQRPVRMEVHGCHRPAADPIRPR